jgi:hypothetical protein
MLPSAALILTDGIRAQFDGVDLAERAALVAQHAGICHAFFTGRSAPDLAALGRLRAHGVFGNTLFGWPRLLMSIPAAHITVVFDARTVIEPESLRAMLREAAATPNRGALLVDVGPARKNSLIRVAGDQIVSVMGDGNASNCGIAVIPDALVARVRSVCSMQDAIHRLAKTGDVRPVDVGPWFWRTIETIDDISAIERDYRRHTSQAARTELIARFLRMPAIVRGFFAERLAANVMN